METRKRKMSNQNRTCAAKLVKQDVETENQKGLNPLFMTEILPVILNWLDLVNLKESRLVCSLWGFEGGKILLQNSNIRLKCFATKSKIKSEKNAQLLKFLKTSGISATFNSAIENIGEPNSLKNVPPLLLQQTSTLSIDHGYSHVFDLAKQLPQFLNFFPNLRILHLQKWGEDATDFSPEIKRSLLTKFESLSEIRLKFHERRPYHHLTNLLLEMKNELAVKEVHFQYKSRYGGPTNQFFEKYLESGCNWPIETLILDSKSFILSPTRFNTRQRFLEKISGSLKHLRWDFTGSQTLPAEHLVPWANNLINPSVLNRLETFFIFCQHSDSSANDFSWFLLTLALQLPNLKKLTLNEVPGNGNLEQMVQKWNNHSKALGTSFKSESLVELNILLRQGALKKMNVESLIFFSRRLWPNLKSLWIEHPPNNLPTSGFLLSEWGGLERVDLKFGSMNKKTAYNWTKWLTGGESSKDGAGNSSSGDSTLTLTLKDLKDLKHFGLWESPMAEESNCLVTDFFVENSLKFMTQLQSLHLESSKISEGVKQELTEALGPKVEILFE